MDNLKFRVYLLAVSPSYRENADAGKKGAQFLQICYIAGINHIATKRRHGHNKCIYRAGIRHCRQGFTRHGAVSLISRVAL